VQVPFVERAYNIVGYIMALGLFVFFILALIIKAQLHVTPRTTVFYNSTLTINLAAVFVLPVCVVFWRLQWPIEEEEDDEERE
jgi:hypothetical protein